MFETTNAFAALLTFTVFVAFTEYRRRTSLIDTAGVLGFGPLSLRKRCHPDDVDLTSGNSMMFDGR